MRQTAAVLGNGRQEQAINLPAVFFFVGVVLCGFAAAMLFPAAVDIAEENDDYEVFVTCAAISMFVGLSMALAFRGHRHAMGIREVMLTAPAC